MQYLFLRGFLLRLRSGLRRLRRLILGLLRRLILRLLVLGLLRMLVLRLLGLLRSCLRRLRRLRTRRLCCRAGDIDPVTLIVADGGKVEPEEDRSADNGEHEEQLENVVYQK